MVSAGLGGGENAEAFVGATVSDATASQFHSVGLKPLEEAMKLGLFWFGGGHAVVYEVWERGEQGSARGLGKDNRHHNPSLDLSFILSTTISISI